MFRWLSIVCILLNYAQTEAYSTATICRNPNGRWGTCVSIFGCEPLYRILNDRTTEHYRFLRMSQCHNGADGSSTTSPNVCCTRDVQYDATQQNYDGRIVFPDELSVGKDINGGTMLEVEPILPLPPNCGLMTIRQRIYGGIEAELTEFSWMVNLEYLTDSGAIVSVCAGSLINKRYVLTAAHCIIGDIQTKVGQIISLRLGEHNTKTAVNCNESVCIDPSQRVGIESVKVHEHFGNENGIHQHHDIALLRMDRAVKFSDSIQPVCLPIVEQLAELKNGMKLTVAGWGHNGTVKSTDEKRKVVVPLVDHEMCRQMFVRTFYVADEQQCAGGVFREDSCKGDSGGPLMRLEDGHWFLEGIVSFGRGCGLQQPGIYTGVRSYLDWIKLNVKP